MSKAGALFGQAAVAGQKDTEKLREFAGSAPSVGTIGGPSKFSIALRQEVAREVGRRDTTAQEEARRAPLLAAEELSRRRAGGRTPGAGFASIFEERQRKFAKRTGASSQALGL